MCRKQGQRPEMDILPEDITPVKYEIELHPDLEKHVFTGSELVHFSVSNATNKVHLHAKDLTVTAGTARFTQGGVSQTAVSVTLNNQTTVLTIEFPNSFTVGQPGSLDLEFQGTLNDQMAGFYRSGYTDVHGKPKIMGTTQLEAIDARRMFPCVDEPAKKAVFELTVVVDAALSVVSNMPEAKRTLIAATATVAGVPQPTTLQRVTFLPTPIMSSYLLALCIGEFEFIQRTTKNGTLFRVLCTPGKAHMCEFALEIGIKSLEFYEEFFAIPYPLPKMDMIAVPDFAMGAMENWGLVTYREIDLLCDLNTVSVARKVRLASVVAHELAHQWYGNLVTMTWWNNLWLNESFATFMQSHCLDKIQLEWNIWDQYVNDDLHRARALDGLRSSHPIEVPIPKAEDVEQVFDAISYSKGCSVVRMLMKVMGEEAFREGVRAYMKEHAYGNTVSEDLWDAMQHAADEAAQKTNAVPLDIIGMMQSWISEMGFPVLSVGKTGSDGKCKLSQRWFLSDGSTQPGDETKCWRIPMFVDSDKCEFILAEKEAMVKLPGSSGKVNFNEAAPIRVNYEDPAHITALLERVKDKTLPTSDRVGLLSDARSFARSGLKTIDDLLEVLLSYKNEDNADVWAGIEATIGAVDRILCGGLKKKDQFTRLVMDKLVGPRLKAIGWDNTKNSTDNEKKLRGVLLRLAGSYATDAELVKEARRRYNAYVEDKNTQLLSDDTRTAVFRIVLANPESKEENEATWTYLKSVAEDKTSSQTTKLNVYSALGFAKDVSLKLATLDWCLTDKIKTQDFFYPMMGVRASGEEGADAAWNWIGKNFEAARTRVAKASPSLLASLVQSCAAGGVTYERAKDIEARYKDIPSLTRTVANMVEATNGNAAFLDRCRNTRAALDDKFWDHLLKL